MRAIQGPVLDLVTEQQETNPANNKIVVKIGDLDRIKAMLEESDLSNSSENKDFILGKVLDILHRQCLGEAKEFARNQSS